MTRPGTDIRRARAPKAQVGEAQSGLCPQFFIIETHHQAFFVKKLTKCIYFPKITKIFQQRCLRRRNVNVYQKSLFQKKSPYFALYWKIFLRRVSSKGHRGCPSLDPTVLIMINVIEKSLSNMRMELGVNH